MEELRAAVRRDQLASFVRLKGGFAVPLAGMIFWAALGVAGYYLEPEQWNLAAFVFSGAIFPLAVVLSKLLHSDFMKDQPTATGDVLLPTFIGMLLFYAIAFAAFWESPQLVPLILAVGMSQHWPVIGWSYGKPGIYSAHAIVRSVGAFALWQLMPNDRFTLIPFWVAAVYLVTVVAILVEARREAATAPGEAARTA